MEMSPNVEQIAQALDRTARREKLLEEARGTWRIGWNDVWLGLTSAMFLYLYLKRPEDPIQLVLLACILVAWREKRFESRLDAIVRLLEREA